MWETAFGNYMHGCKTEEVQCALEWNQGGHFKDPVLRIAKAFAWVLNTENGKG